jgi:uncharacterized damage-inducible protein DinB
MTPESLVAELKSSKEFFDRATRNLDEKDAGFAPVEGMLTAAQQVAHVAQTIDWFIEGAFGSGFTMDFEQHIKDVEKIKTLKDGRAWLEKSYAQAIKAFEQRSEAEIMKPLPAGPIMGGMPRAAIAGAIAEHTAHHRGALSVYTRLRGKVPPMPYMEMEPAASLSS